jgi:serine/threonine protein kinase
LFGGSRLRVPRGGFSIVKKAKKRDTGVNYAVKIITKMDKKKEELQLLQREIDIMHKLASPNIITLEEVYETDDTIYLVLEL